MTHDNDAFPLWEETLKGQPMTEARHTELPWDAGCFVYPESECQCKYILCGRYAGSIATISVGNGKSIGEGGNGNPPIEEARANATFIVKAVNSHHALARACMIALIALDLDPENSPPQWSRKEAGEELRAALKAVNHD